MNYTLKTSLGNITGLEQEYCYKFLGVPFAAASRFEYAEPITEYGDLDCTKPGKSCTQKRPKYQNLTHPTRRFYYKEFREGINFEYGEDCLNMNIFMPKDDVVHPILVYVFGGGFDSGSINEGAFDGTAFAKLGITVFFITYRVGVFGFFCHKEIQSEYGRDGNFGLDDIKAALEFIKKHASDFKGDPDNITLMGQSNGAMSIQYLCCNEKHKGLFNKAIMLSGGGKLPDIALPKPHEKVQEYWKRYMDILKCNTLDELKGKTAEELIDASEALKRQRKDNQTNTMPVIDGYLIDKPIKAAIKNPLDIPYIVGYTNCDLYGIVMAGMAHKYAEYTNTYLCYFDIDAPGDHNKAFHASELRYIFNTLASSWRPYDEVDKQRADDLINYLVNFIKTGDPNDAEHPIWKKDSKRALRITRDRIYMSKPDKLQLTYRTITKPYPKDEREYVNKGIIQP